MWEFRKENDDFLLYIRHCFFFIIIIIIMLEYICFCYYCKICYPTYFLVQDPSIFPFYLLFYFFLSRSFTRCLLSVSPCTDRAAVQLIKCLDRQALDWLLRN